MRKFKYFLFLAFLFVSLLTYSQQQYPQHYFSSPLKIPITLAGTFGELRANHFHSGLDIKTLGKEGLKVYAPADGYISRIKVSQWGYGKALYITHPNGYTTVYAHLSRFAAPIQAYIKKVQYRKQSYDTGNLFFGPEKFRIKKGQVIAYTGDTGSSGGPHLHFEIRNTKSEKVINPMFFGVKPTDTKAPVFKKLMVYPLSNDARINSTATKTIIPIKNIGNNTYVGDRIMASGVIGFGVDVFDQLNGAPNHNGIYSLEMKVNGLPMYYHNVETFSFQESKYINLLIDYSYFAKYRNRIQKTYKTNSNKLSIYKNLINNGKLKIENGASYQVEIIAKDFKGNTSTVKIPIKGVETTLLFKTKDTTPYKITAKNFTKFKQKNVTVAFPKNTFYEDCYLDFEVADNIAKIHEPTIPLDKSYTLTFDVSNYSESQKKQLYIANVTKKNSSYYVTTRKKENIMYTLVKNLGSYTLKSDTQSPTITLVNFKNNQWVSKLNNLKVKITDSDSGIDIYRATIDNQWVLMEYNHKKGILTYDFNDKKLVGSKHVFKLAVSDNVGNTKNISVTFFRK
ncbi:M23 family metallopeptidase [Tenacibaculum sp. UWU-22]|uniref:M23 family metallopeptidase n=1 Tax=Tenacibaculum sp. UWU-22 TaxID=3234187 RepID=UPI0034DB0297